MKFSLIIFGLFFLVLPITSCAPPHAIKEIGMVYFAWQQEDLYRQEEPKKSNYESWEE